MRARSAFLIGLITILSGLIAPATALAANPLAPYLYSQDAPFTRNQTVDIGYVQPTGDAIRTFVLSNDNAVNGQGSLLNGAAPVAGQWTLPNGDGAHTVYGQVQYDATGNWSIVVSLDFQLGTVGSSLYVDLDIVNAGGQDGHAISHSPGARFTAYKTPVDTSPATGFVVSDGTWIVGFYDTTGSFAPGTYAVGASAGASISHAPLHSTCTVNGGSFTINEVVLFQGRDLDRADVDFRLLCGTNVMAGSLRYGSGRAIVALDQDVTSLAMLEAVLGQPTASQTVTFTNIGDVTTHLGTASIGGTNSGDFAITSDSCSGVDLAVGLNCSVSLRSTPTVRGNRFGLLSIPDPTSRGSRAIPLFSQGVEAAVLSLDAPLVPGYAPGHARFVTTMTPPIEPFSAGARLDISGGQYRIDSLTTVDLTNPARRVVTVDATLGTGNYTVTATFEACCFYGPTQTQSITFTVAGDSTSPTGTLSITSQSGDPNYTPSRDVNLSSPATDNASVTGMAVSNDGVTWQEGNYAASRTWTLPAGDGPHTVYVRWYDAALNVSAVVTDTIVLDTGAPSVVAPASQLLAGTDIAGGKVPLQLNWSASDGISGLSSFSVAKQSDSGAWTTFSTGGLNGAASTNKLLTCLVNPGHQSDFRSRAKDRAGTLSAWATANPLSVLAFPGGQVHYPVHGHVDPTQQLEFLARECQEHVSRWRDRNADIYGSFVRMGLARRPGSRPSRGIRRRHAGNYG